MTGLDGRSRPAKKPKLCDKCARLGATPGCPQCESIRAAPAREKAAKEAEKQRKAEEKANAKAEREAAAARDGGGRASGQRPPPVA